MKIQFETTPEEDALLQKLSDEAMIGRGNQEQPALDTFTITYFHVILANGINAQVKSKREEIKALVEILTPTDLDNIKAAIEVVTKK